MALVVVFGVAQRSAAASDVFEFEVWGAVSPPAGWSFVAGDFDGGPDDVLGYSPTNGTLWLGHNTGSGFDFGAAPWAAVSPPDGWVFVAGNFDSGRTDVVGYHRDTGTVWFGRNTGTGLAFTLWATVSPRDALQLTPGDFDGGAGGVMRRWHLHTHEREPARRRRGFRGAGEG